MRFLVIGLGSAGQRHARVMRKVFPEAEIDVFVKGRKVGLISKDLTSINLSESPTQHYKLNEIESIPKTANFYDLAVIATPISSHYEYFQMMFDCSRRVLIEKPIARTLDESLLISNASMASGKAVLVGYQHSFNPISNWIKEICSIRKTPKSLEIYFKEYLRDMNPFRNMDTHHLASRDGGGVLLALSHEIDLLLQIWSGDLMSLKSETFFSFEFSGVFDRLRLFNSMEKKEPGQTKINVELSLANGPRSRGGTVIWDEEIATWDYFAKTARIKSNEENGSEIQFHYHGDDLIESQFRFLMQKETFDYDLKTRLDRAVDVLRLNDSITAGDSIY